MGSRLNQNNEAYIAGFLDGDGSLMLQVKARSDTSRGARFMATICFYQDSRHDEPLEWIQTMLQAGYLSRRRDGMTELRINGFAQVGNVLKRLQPFIRFKKKQVTALIQACDMLSSVPLRLLSETQVRQLVELMFVIKQENYRSGHTRSKDEILRRLGLTP